MDEFEEVRTLSRALILNKDIKNKPTSYLQRDTTV